MVIEFPAKQRYLVSFDPHNIPIFFTDILVLGSGIAGLSSAIEASQYCNVTVVTKAEASMSNTYYAQGGIACPFSSEDSIQNHLRDTLQVSQGIADEQAAKWIIKHAKQYVDELIQWGTVFDRSSSGKLDLAKEGGHSKARILHAGGDATGAEIERALISKLKNSGNCNILENTFSIDLLTAGNTCVGALLFNSVNKFFLIMASKTILATGGAGQVFRETTNPEIATGDGIAMAFRANCVVSDMEFIQFHPTTLYIAGASRALISETTRGEGGYLRDKNGYRFMPDYHPSAELAPRDVVSRSILEQMRKTNDTNVYLDLTHLPAKTLETRFPKLKQLCESFGLDIKKDIIPVRPSAHYTIGGVKTDLFGMTSIKNLYACGEAACTGFHGANRLGSNSLLEGLVMGRTAALHAGKNLHKDSLSFDKIKLLGTPKTQLPGIPVELDIDDMTNSLKSQMWRNAGPERTHDSLQEALSKINFWAGYVFPMQFQTVNGWELQNLLTAAYLITTCSLNRTESRGCHYRKDFPEKDDKNWKKHQNISLTKGV